MPPSPLLQLQSWDNNTRVGTGNKLAERPSPHAPMSRKNNSYTFGIMHSIAQGCLWVGGHVDVRSPWETRCQGRICTRQVLWRCLRSSLMALGPVVMVAVMEMVQGGRFLPPRLWMQYSAGTELVREKSDSLDRGPLSSPRTGAQSRIPCTNCSFCPRHTKGNCPFCMLWPCWDMPRATPHLRTTPKRNCRSPHRGMTWEHRSHFESYPREMATQNMSRRKWSKPVLEASAFVLVSWNIMWGRICVSLANEKPVF